MHIVPVGRGLFLLAALLGCAAILSGGGCNSASVSTSREWGWELPKPDKIVVHNFAVTPAEVKLDRGAMATAVRDAQNRSVPEEEAKLGHLVSEKLSQTLVEELNKAGIDAVRAGPNVKVTNTSIVLTGTFLNIDEGNQTARIWIGFGLGGSKLRTELQANQGKLMIAEAQTTTDAGLSPGMVTSAGSNSANVAASAAGTGFSETVMNTAEADARRTAKAIVKEVQKAYQRRGWVVKAS
jgi:hypothetical protein